MNPFTSNLDKIIKFFRHFVNPDRIQLQITSKATRKSENLNLIFVFMSYLNILCLYCMYSMLWWLWILKFKLALFLFFHFCIGSWINYEMTSFGSLLAPSILIYEQFYDTKNGLWIWEKWMIARSLQSPHIFTCGHISPLDGSCPE